MSRLFPTPPGPVRVTRQKDLTPASLKGLLDKFRAGRTPPPGSSLGRQATAPVGGPLTLRDPTLYDGSRAKPFKLPNMPEPA